MSLLFVSLLVCHISNNKKKAKKQYKQIQDQDPTHENRIEKVWSTSPHSPGGMAQPLASRSY
eukprot:m.139456 g.139456  ORF g.139456 m.139456 type:complete len:62 (+) comp30056_c0_seq1:269-454(+)